MVGEIRSKRPSIFFELIEQSYGHKEIVDSLTLTIEHILPQKLSDLWKDDLGENWQDTHDLYLHTLGNLTLTAYNAELSNDSFEEKKRTLQRSHLELNKYFTDKTHWREEEIKQRAEFLADKCLQIWPYFGEENTQLMPEVTGTKPTHLIIWGQEHVVKHWAEVLEQIVRTVADLAPEKLEILIKEYPRFINTRKEKFRRSAEIAEGVYLEKNHSADTIQKFCTLAMETIEITTDDWQVRLS